MNSYREELIQVAAVALAALQDHDVGSTKMHYSEGKEMVFESIVADVERERNRQEKKWGEQHHSKEKWLIILTEEVGEVARAILENK